MARLLITGPRLLWFGATTMFAVGVLGYLVMPPRATGVTVPPLPAERLYQIGGERIGPLTVCGSDVVYEQRTWGSEGQMCVAVLRRTWTSTRRVAIACGTQVYAFQVGQPCGR